MIKAKGLMLTRLASSIIFLFAFLIVFLFDLIMTNDLVFEIILVISIAFFFLLVIGLSLEMKFFRNHSRIFISIIILGMISAEIYIILTDASMLYLNFIIILTSLIGVLSWYYALSINKKKKILFCFLSSMYYLINFTLQFYLQLPENYFILRLNALNVVLICITLILMTEYIMKRKGYLKYL